MTREVQPGKQPKAGIHRQEPGRRDWSPGLPARGEACLCQGVRPEGASKPFQRICLFSTSEEGATGGVVGGQGKFVETAKNPGDIRELWTMA